MKKTILKILLVPVVLACFEMILWGVGKLLIITNLNLLTTYDNTYDMWLTVIIGLFHISLVASGVFILIGIYKLISSIIG